MEIAQLNVRIDARVKREGDAALARLGISATEAIRALWNYLAETQTVPSFMRNEEAQRDEAKPTSSVADTGAGLALAMARDRGLASAPDDLSYDELRELAFEELAVEGVYRV